MVRQGLGKKQGIRIADFRPEWELVFDDDDEGLCGMCERETVSAPWLLPTVTGVIVNLGSQSRHRGVPALGRACCWPEHSQPYRGDRVCVRVRVPAVWPTSCMPWRMMAGMGYSTGVGGDNRTGKI
jgi:hypothetical protein